MSHWRMLSLLVLTALAAAAPTALGAQDPKPTPRKVPTPKPDEAPFVLPGLDRVAPPAALSRADLARRLRALGGTLPDALPAGATTTLGPDRLHVGRSWLVLRNVDLLDPRPGWAVAKFNPCGNETVVYLEFDAEAHARYVLDAFVAEEGYCYGPTLLPHPPLPPFRVTVQGPGIEAGAHDVILDAGHVLFAFDTATTARYRVRIQLREYFWSFYRVDLTRLR